MSLTDQELKRATEQLRFIANNLLDHTKATEEQNRLLASINQKLAFLVRKG
jgi:hypothetical protein